MDELWQRYRTFWRPVLLGLGVFLLGLIVVHILTPDPDAGASRVSSAKRRLAELVEPNALAAKELKGDVGTFGDSAQRLAAALDPSAAGKDTLTVLVTQTLEDAFDAAGSEEGAREAKRLSTDRVNLFRTGNPNVAFSALLSDVWGVLRSRANRADMDLDAESLGFSNVPSITRGELLRRLSNLALVTRVTATAIRTGGVSLDEVRFENPRGQPEGFLQEWPVTVVLTVPTRCVEAILETLTDPRHPVPIGTTLIQQPRKMKPAQGIVEMTLLVDSVAVNPAASLNLDLEEEGV